MRFLPRCLVLAGLASGGNIMEQLLMELMKATGADSISDGEHANVKLLASASEFDSFVQANNTVSAVFFTAPWCFPCKPLLEIWAEAADIVSNQTNNEMIVQFGVIEISKFPELAESNHIHQLPTMKLYVDEEIFSYTHENVHQPFSAGVVTRWVNTHTNRSNKLGSRKELEIFLKANPLTLVLMVDEKSDSNSNSKNDMYRDAISHSAHHFEDVAFVEVPSELARDIAELGSSTAGEIKSFPAVVMLYDHDDKYAVLPSGLDKEIAQLTDAIDDFVRGRRLLLVNVFQPGTIDYILDSGLPLLVLVSPTGFDDAKEKEILKTVAAKYIGRLTAVTVGGTANPWEDKMREIVDAKNVLVPEIRILQMPEEITHDHDTDAQGKAAIKKSRKYKPNDDDVARISESNLILFIEKFLTGKLQPHVRSEPLPENPRESFTPGSVLVTAVGLNFQKIVVNDVQRDVLVVYHADYCGHCKKMAPTLKELGTKLAGNAKGFKIVKIEATKNDIPDVSIPGYPMIVLYKATKNIMPLNQRPQVDYQGDRSLESLIAFLHEHAVNKIDENAAIDAKTYKNGNNNVDTMFFEEL